MITAWLLVTQRDFPLLFNVTKRYNLLCFFPEAVIVCWISVTSTGIIEGKNTPQKKGVNFQKKNTFLWGSVGWTLENLSLYTLDNLCSNATASLTSNLTERLHCNPVWSAMITLDGSWSRGSFCLPGFPLFCWHSIEHGTLSSTEIANMLLQPSAIKMITKIPCYRFYRCQKAEQL